MGGIYRGRGVRGLEGENEKEQGSNIEYRGDNSKEEEMNEGYREGFRSIVVLVVREIPRKGCHNSWCFQ